MCWQEQRKEDKRRKQTLKKRQFNRDSSKWRKRKEIAENLQKKQDTLKEVNNLEKLEGGKVSND